MQIARTIVGESTLSGLGVFADEHIAAGQTIMDLSGKRISEHEADTMLESGSVRADDVFQVSANEYLILDRLPVLINHSCDPSTGVRGENQLVALRDIRPGEEITYDYSSVVGAGNDGWTMACNCNTKLCRKIIGSVLSLPRLRLDFYRARGVLPATWE